MIGNINDLSKIEVKHPDAKLASMQVLVSPEQGWEDYVMRVVEVKESGYTPKHAHPWPHINYMIEGKGVLMINGKEKEVFPGSYAYVPSDTIHQFKNIGKTDFKFICIVPKEGHKL